MVTNNKYSSVWRKSDETETNRENEREREGGSEARKTKSFVVFFQKVTISFNIKHL